MIRVKSPAPRVAGSTRPAAIRVWDAAWQARSVSRSRCRCGRVARAQSFTISRSHGGSMDRKSTTPWVAAHGREALGCSPSSATSHRSPAVGSVPVCWTQARSR